MITISDLSFQYGTAAIPALRDISLTINAGDIVMLSGRSGSGKTTLLYALNGIVPHHFQGGISGSVVINGIDVHDSPVHNNAQHVGCVFQNPETQFCTLYVEDEVAFGLENLCVPREQLRVRVRSALQMVGIADLWGRELAHLSGGQKQKVALAAVLAMDPAVLLLDQPCDNLDPVSARAFYALLGRIRAETGKTIVIIEPRLDRIAPLIDRTVILRDGALIFDGVPEQKDAELLAENGVWLPVGWESSHAKAQRREGGDVGIEVRGLTYQYNGAAEPALNNVSFTIKTGAFCAIAGANGAGKTTLLKHLVGIIPTRRDTNYRVPTGAGFVFQNPEHQFVTQTVRDELAYGLKDRDRDRDRDGEIKIETVAEQFDLVDLLDANPFALSHGQKRLLSVATAVITQPKTLILDEPTIGLDRTAALDLMDKLATLNAQGVTIIFITHDMRLINWYAEQVIVMAHGRIIFDGAPDDLFMQEDVLTAANLLTVTNVTNGKRERTSFTIHH